MKKCLKVLGVLSGLITFGILFSIFITRLFMGSSGPNIQVLLENAYRESQEKRISSATVIVSGQ